MTRSFKILLFFLYLFFCHQDIVAKVKPLVNYTIDNGLFNNGIYKITQDNERFIWLGTDNVVFKTKLLSKAYKNLAGL